MTRGPSSRVLGEVGRAGAAAAALAFATVVALRPVPAWERRLFRSIHSLPDVVEPVLWLPMQLGSLWGPVAVAGALRRGGGHGSVPVRVVVAGTASWQLAKVVKARVRRGRPGGVLDGVRRRRGTPRSGLGFPSGHTAVAASIAVVAAPSLGATGAVLCRASVAVVALARVHVGAHLPLDTVGGAALGAAVGHVVNAAASA